MGGAGSVAMGLAEFAVYGRVLNVYRGGSCFDRSPMVEQTQQLNKASTLVNNERFLGLEPASRIANASIGCKFMTNRPLHNGTLPDKVARSLRERPSACQARRLLVGLSTASVIFTPLHARRPKNSSLRARLQALDLPPFAYATVTVCQSPLAFGTHRA